MTQSHTPGGDTAREAPEGLTRIVVRGVGLAGSGYLLTQLLTVIAYLVLARLITPTEMGQFAAGSLVMIAALFAESGMLAALIQRPDRIEEAAATAVLATLAAGVAFALAALAASPLIGLFFDSREIGLVAAALAPWVLIRQAAVVPEALLQRRFSFLRRLVAEPASVVAFGVTAIVAAAAGLGVWALVAGSYAAVVTQAASAWVLARWWPDLSLASFALWRELVSYGKHVTGAGLVRVATSESGTIFVGRFLGAATLGQFQYTYRIAQRPLTALVSSVTYVVFPAFARIAEDPARFERGFMRTVRWLSVVAFPASFILLPLGEPAVVLLFGERWQEAGEALTWMFGYTVGWAFVSLAEHVAKAVGRPEVVLRLDVAALVVTVAAVAALVEFGLDLGCGRAVRELDRRGRLRVCLDRAADRHTAATAAAGDLARCGRRGLHGLRPVRTRPAAARRRPACYGRRVGADRAGGRARRDPVPGRAGGAGSEDGRRGRRPPPVGRRPTAVWPWPVVRRQRSGRVQGSLCASSRFRGTTSRKDTFRASARACATREARYASKRSAARSSSGRGSRRIVIRS